MTTRERPDSRRRGRCLVVLAVAAASLLATAACSFGGAGADAAVGAAPSPAASVRLGFFGNLTHAPALVAVNRRAFERELGSTQLKTQVFNAGPAAIEALSAGAIDAAYVGPTPAINAFIRSRGEAIRIVSGATSGGAQLVVRRDLTSPRQLRGAHLASPQLGGTQDVALRTWLTRNGLHNSTHGAGDVTITPTENAQTLRLFEQGSLDGAWLPEPWASRLVLEGDAGVLVDERALWPGGRFLTTHLVVTTTFLRRHPQTVEALLRAHVESIEWINAHRDEAQQVTNAEIEAASGKPLSDAVLRRGFANITVTSDPLAATLPRLLGDAVSAGVARGGSLAGIYDLRLLNKVRKRHNLPAVSAAGLGKE